MVAASQTSVRATADQYALARQRIDQHIQTIANSPDRRDGAFPYYQFHQPEEPIQGTVLIFHGFSARPDQMWRLADYLFANGYNIYQANLAGHAYCIPDRYWPQVDLKSEIRDPLHAKVQHDPVLQTFLQNLQAADASALQSLSPQQMFSITARLQSLEPRLLDIVKAIERSKDPDFEQYFDSSHMDYLKDAEERLAELDSLPGPIYTVGLSVGGAVALALAATHPERIQKVVTYAPLLKIAGAAEERYVNLAGPLDIREFGWDDQLSFPLGCFTANNRFGAFVREPQNIASLRRIPTLMVLTENEDAADLHTSQQFNQALQGRFWRSSAAVHYLNIYPSHDLVPHPMVDPTEVSQGMSNAFWQSLYQETFRFFQTGQFNPENLSRLTQDQDLPSVPPV